MPTTIRRCFPVFGKLQHRSGAPLGWISEDRAEWMVTIGAARFFRHHELRGALELTNHKLFNIQIKHGGYTVGPLGH
jgi:hypothetical protein